MNYETVRKMAAEGDAAAQCYLGHIYEEGEGIEPDIQTALSWFYCAAKQGNAPAQWKLGKMYGNGIGVAADPEASFNWYQLAAEQGFSDAYVSLGRAFETGRRRCGPVRADFAGRRNPRRR